MQRLATANLSRPARARCRAVGAAAVALALAGCGPTAASSAAKPDARPLAGTALTVSCPDARLAAVLGPAARVWAARTGATVEVTAAPMTDGDAADVGVVPFAEVGAWADRGALVPVPVGLKEPGHPYQWSGVLAVYRGEPCAGWGGQLLALPLAGDAAVVVYRADLFKQAGDEFRAKTGRPLAAPATWEDLADAAAFFAERDKRPGLPRSPADPARLVGLFSRVASCYDRAAVGEGAGSAAAAGTDPLAFQFRTDDGRPRLDAPGFALAAAWLAGLKARGCVPADGPADPVAALAEGRAVAAVLTLDEVARLRPNGGRVDSRYGVAPLPGTRGFADPRTGRLTSPGANYVPHFAGGWFGVVRTRCPNPDAAFDLLAELGGPARSQEVIAATGYGPFRDAHLDRERLVPWLGYGFDDERTRALQDAARAFVGKAVRNPTYGLRGPDHAALTAALAGELNRVASGTIPPADGLKQATAAWDRATADVPADTLRERRRKAVGLN